MIPYEKKDRRAVKMLRHWNGYNGGEVCGFAEHVATSLCEGEDPAAVPVNPREKWVKELNGGTGLFVEEKKPKKKKKKKAPKPKDEEPKDEEPKDEEPKDEEPKDEEPKEPVKEKAEKAPSNKAMSSRDMVKK